MDVRVDKLVLGHTRLRGVKGAVRLYDGCWGCWAPVLAFEVGQGCSFSDGVRQHVLDLNVVPAVLVNNNRDPADGHAADNEAR